MYLIRIVVVFFALLVPAAAQQVDSVFLQRAIAAVQTQRNLAMDAAAVAEAKIVAITEERDKAQARVKELEAKGEEKK